MKDPAFLFYSQDFLTGTYLMTNEQIGKYIRLLCLQHQKGSLSEKDMMKICETHDEDIFCKFKIEDGQYYNQRLRDEAKKRSDYSNSRKNNRKGGKKEDMNNISNSCDKHMENENENENEIVNEIVNENEVENKNEFSVFQFANLEKLKSTRPYIENVMQLFNISENQVNLELDRFWLEKQHTGELDRSQNEVFGHFKNWLKKQKQNNNGKSKRTYTDALREWDISK